MEPISEEFMAYLFKSLDIDGFIGVLWEIFEGFSWRFKFEGNKVNKLFGVLGFPIEGSK